MIGEPLELRQDPVPVLVCGCGHCEVEHRCDTKRDDYSRRKCARGGCGCAVFRPVERRWRVHGWVSELIEQ